jgi:hypothetical protein
VNYLLEKDIALGKQMAQEVERKLRLSTIRWSRSTSTVWAKNLVCNSDAKVPFTIKVLDTDEVNALRFRAASF